jgi:hypothetical protein
MAVYPTGRTHRFHLALLGAMIVGGAMVSGIAAAAAVTPAAAVNHGLWTYVPSPNSPTTLNNFDSISCSSASSCMAVGGLGDEGPLIEQWDGSSWTVMAPGSPASAAETLQGVSCGSPTFCVAVGYSEDSPGTIGALEQWNGTVWTVVPDLAPDFSDLNAVSCTGPDFCIVVGSEYEYPIAADPIVLEWNGSTWNTSVGTDVPQDTPDNLNGVSCTGPDACQAVGDAYVVSCQPPMGGCTVVADRPITASWNGSGFLVSAPATPHGGDLTAVSCTGPSACTAVGEHNSVHCHMSMGVKQCTLGSDYPLIETFDGSTWSVERGVNRVSSILASVSCSSATTCVAVAPQFIEEESGAGWSRDSPAVIAGSVGQSFGGVTCTGIGPCDVVGSYSTGSAVDTLVETRSG